MNLVLFSLLSGHLSLSSIPVFLIPAKDINTISIIHKKPWEKLPQIVNKVQIIFYLIMQVIFKSPQFCLVVFVLFFCISLGIFFFQKSYQHFATLKMYTQYIFMSHKLMHIQVLYQIKKKSYDKTILLYYLKCPNN